jgi:hypothetical protein
MESRLDKCAANEERIRVALSPDKAGVRLLAENMHFDDVQLDQRREDH